MGHSDALVWGVKGLSNPDGQVLDHGQCLVFEELQTNVHWLAKAVLNCLNPVPRLLPGKDAEWPNECQFIAARRH